VGVYFLNTVYKHSNDEMKSSVPYVLKKVVHLRGPQTSHDNQATAADTVHMMLDLNCIVNDAERWMLTTNTLHAQTWGS